MGYSIYLYIYIYYIHLNNNVRSLKKNRHCLKLVDFHPIIPSTLVGGIPTPLKNMSQLGPDDIHN